LAELFFSDGLVRDGFVCVERFVDFDARAVAILFGVDVQDVVAREHELKQGYGEP
jgi:hypothetical protein